MNFTVGLTAHTSLHNSFLISATLKAISPQAPVSA